jgi:hypothetical protein
MSYSTPVTDWAAGDPVLNTDMNRIESNIAYLHNPPFEDHVMDDGADYTTSSATFVDVDGGGTELEVSITVDATTVLEIAFCGQIFNALAAAITYFDVTKDGARIGGDDGLWATAIYTSASASKPGVCFFRYIEVSAGTYIFKLQWKVSAGTTTLYAGAGSATLDTHGQFVVRKC